MSLCVYCRNAVQYSVQPDMFHWVIGDQFPVLYMEIQVVMNIIDSFCLGSCSTYGVYLFHPAAVYNVAFDLHIVKYYS